MFNSRVFNMCYTQSHATYSSFDTGVIPWEGGGGGVKEKKRKERKKNRQKDRKIANYVKKVVVFNDVSHVVNLICCLTLIQTNESHEMW